MIKGHIAGSHLYVTIHISWQHAVQELTAIIDTGFDGDIRLSPQRAKELGLLPDHVEKVRLADDSIKPMPASIAYVQMEESMHTANVLIEGTSPMIGTGLLKKFDYTLIADFKRNRVVLDSTRDHTHPYTAST